MYTISVSKRIRQVKLLYWSFSVVIHLTILLKFYCDMERGVLLLLYIPPGLVVSLTITPPLLSNTDPMPVTINYYSL